MRDQLFGDEEFAALYTLDNERPSVSPSLLATALLLQAHDKVSDAEAHRRTRLDLGWKVALGVEADAKPFAQSTLQHFRAQLILLRTPAQVQSVEVAAWAEAEGYARYLEPSIKGSTEVDWSDPEARRGFLAAIVADAERLLGQALTSPPATDRAHPDRPRIMAAAELLCKLLLQDIERRADGVAVREGVSRDRIVSVSDPEMRHGRKSSHRCFDGHKASLAVESGSQLITAVAGQPGNGPDNQGALDLVSESERNLGDRV